MKTALVIGGTGPTGHHIVNGLLRRGYQVAILHRGGHEVEEIPPEVEHIHVDPYDEASFLSGIGDRQFDLCIAAYGRLRMIAQQMVGRCDQFISIGGAPAYAGYMNPRLPSPEGLMVPTAETATLVSEAEQDEKGYRIVRTEQAVFECQPDATHFRYPFIYGKYQLVPREWCVVRRILDKRPFIILPDDGLSLCSYGYAGNMAHAVLLAVDNPEAARGEIFNCADDICPSVRQVVEIIAAALDASIEIVSMPFHLAQPAWPLIGQPLPTHRVLDTAKLRYRLNYEDQTHPAVAIADTARQLAASPLEKGGTEEWVLQDPFDYRAEDALAASWKTACDSMQTPEYRSDAPGVGLAYSGPGGRPRSQKEFKS